VNNEGWLTTERELNDRRAAMAAELQRVTAERDRWREDHEDLRDRLGAWPQCPDGCGCDLATGDPDAEVVRLQGLIREMLENTGLDDDEQARWLDMAGIPDEDEDGGAS
jgi:hypothetical protein